MSAKFFYCLHPSNGGVVFATEKRALLIDQIYRAADTAKTWGEFKKLIPDEEYDEIFSHYDDDEDNIPRSEDPFEFSSIPGVDEGDYPPWLQSEMNVIGLPEGFFEQFATLVSTVINGNYWHIQSENMSTAIEFLRSHGYEVVDGKHLKFW